MTAPTESAANRFDRDFEHRQDDRKLRDLDNQPIERASREYVNYETGTTPADDDLVNPNPS